jgi:hypothetical protein
MGDYKGYFLLLIISWSKIGDKKGYFYQIYGHFYQEASGNPGVRKQFVPWDL